MQPSAQLSLELDDLPAPAPQVLERLPEPVMTAAALLLARLIAKAVHPESVAAGEGADGDA